MTLMMLHHLQYHSALTFASVHVIYVSHIQFASTHFRHFSINNTGCSNNTPHL